MLMRVIELTFLHGLDLLPRSIQTEEAASDLQCISQTEGTLPLSFLKYLKWKGETKPLKQTFECKWKFLEHLLCFSLTPWQCLWESESQYTQVAMEKAESHTKKNRQ